MEGTEPEQVPAEVYAGVLLGTAVGDALGLPAEGLSPRRIRQRWNGDWRMRLVAGRGMISDDTEHTLMVAQALLAEPEDVRRFERILGWKLRWWFLGLPGGVGWATAKACLKLWLGFPAGRSAVRSGGSGPAMRSAILGAYFARDHQRRREFVAASTRLTHRGWQAETAALAVAELAVLSIRRQGQPPVAELLEVLLALSAEPEWRKLLGQMEESLAVGSSVGDFAVRLGLGQGVAGYALHVVPMAIYAWARHPRDFRLALTNVLDCGGDTDTTGAILGALAGAVGGREAIPSAWVAGIAEWPRSVGFVERVAGRLTEQRRGKQTLGPIRLFWPGVLIRNLVFLVVILGHGFRRLLPPWGGG